MTKVWTPPPLARAASTVTLTPRQADVLTGLAHGLSNADIGRRLYLTENSIKTHCKRIFRTLGARDRTHAVALAISGQVVIEVADTPWRHAA